MAKSDEEQTNFFYTQVNEFFDREITNSRDLPKYKTHAVNWLYDRAQTFLNSFIGTGNSDMLREGLRAGEHYQDLIFDSGECADAVSDERCRGFFSLKDASEKFYKDTKYSYNEILINYYLLTGDDTVIPKIADVSNVLRLVSMTRPGTERFLANVLLGLSMDYELTENPYVLENLKACVDWLYERQNTALEGEIINGCFNIKPESGSINSF